MRNIEYLVSYQGHAEKQKTDAHLLAINSCDRYNQVLKNGGERKRRIKRNDDRKQADWRFFRLESVDFAAAVHNWRRSTSAATGASQINGADG